jgi:hypothetical protein
MMMRKRGDENNNIMCGGDYSPHLKNSVVTTKVRSQVEELVLDWTCPHLVHGHLNQFGKRVIVLLVIIPMKMIPCIVTVLGVEAR